MVLDHVAQGPGFLVIRAAPLDANRFGGRDLNVIDIAAVPERLEHAVSEPEGQNVLNRLLAQVMIDPIDLRFIEDLVNLVVQMPRAVQIVAEGLLNNHAPPSAAVIQMVLAKLENCFGVMTGLRGQIKENVSRGLMRYLYVVQLVPQIVIRRRIVEVARHIEQ